MRAAQGRGSDPGSETRQHNDTGDQRLKVLDFGLAKVFLGGPGARQTGEQEDLSTRVLTQPGLIMGTISYFSPEQAQGQRIDRRSDIFSLGIILYQMSTGRHPFPGTSAATIISSILRDAPAPVAEFEAPWVKRMHGVIERCLEKDPEQRYQQVSEIIDDLMVLQRDPGASLGPKGTEDLIQAGREALGRHSWTKALQCLQQADAETALSPDDLIKLPKPHGGPEGWTSAATYWNERTRPRAREAPSQRALMALRLADITITGRPLGEYRLAETSERLLENAEDPVEYGYLLRSRRLLL